jgi:hypothetical protein
MGSPVADVLLEALDSLALAAHALLDAPPEEAKSSREALECQARAASRVSRHVPPGRAFHALDSLQRASQVAILRRRLGQDFAVADQALRDAVRCADELLQAEKRPTLPGV